MQIHWANGLRRIRNLTLGCSDSEEKSDNEEIQLVDLTAETETWLIQLLRSSDINWFEFVYQIKSSTQLQLEPQEPISEVKLWHNSLYEIQINRQRGAAKAAETQRAKNS